MAPRVILDIAANDAVQFGEHVFVQIAASGCKQELPSPRIADFQRNHQLGFSH
jgi:hypothetical protein